MPGLQKTGNDELGQQIERLLDTVREFLDMDAAILSEFAGEDRVLRYVSSRSSRAVFNPGEVRAVGSGYCLLVAQGRLPAVIPDTRANGLAQGIPETYAVPIGAHLGVALRRAGGEPFGMLCFISHRTRPDLDDRHLLAAEMSARVLVKTMETFSAANGRRGVDEEALDRVLADGDPAMVYQPIVDLGDNAIHEVEALSRFRGPPHLTPDRWFAMAHGLNRGQWLELVAIRRALAECAALPSGASVAINVSPRTLVSTDLVPHLESFEMSRLVVELTEHEPIADYGPLVAALEPLRERGVKVAIDDAGAGYSSLGHVLRLKPDIIKMDRSFTHGIDVDPAKLSLVSALCTFAKDTGVITVAEGIETQGEADALRAAGIGRGQGHLFGRPMAIEALRELLEGAPAYAKA